MKGGGTGRPIQGERGKGSVPRSKREILLLVGISDGWKGPWKVGGV